MKRLPVVFFVSLVALPLLAAQPRHTVTTVGTAASVQPASPEMVTRVMAQAKERFTRRTQGVHASAIADSRSARMLLIPAAGSTPGGGGQLFFRSDVTLINYDTAPQVVLALYWPQGTSNPPGAAALTSKQVTLPPASAVTYVDFVATVMNSSGLGTLVFFPMDSTGLDSSAAIDGLSRIYTKQPGSQGTVSQEFPPIDLDWILPSDTAAALGLRQDANFRTNYGIVNFDSDPHTFVVFFEGERLSNAVEINVPAFGMKQTKAPDGDYGALTVKFMVSDNTDYIQWSGYATSTDNITGDGWVSVASVDLNPGDLDAIFARTGSSSK